jgi:predicted ester cyclase
MMRHELLEQIIEEVWNQGQLNRSDEFYLSDVIYRRPPMPDVVGLEAYKENIQSTRKGFPDFKLVAEEDLVHGDISLIRGRFLGTHTGESSVFEIPPTGKQVDVLWCAVGYWRDGKVQEEWCYIDWLGFMQQLGYSVIPPGTTA